MLGCEYQHRGGHQDLRERQREEAGRRRPWAAGGLRRCRKEQDQSREELGSRAGVAQEGAAPGKRRDQSAGEVLQGSQGLC